MVTGVILNTTCIITALLWICAHCAAHQIALVDSLALLATWCAAPNTFLKLLTSLKWWITSWSICMWNTTQSFEHWDKCSLMIAIIGIEVFQISFSVSIITYICQVLCPIWIFPLTDIMKWSNYATTAICEYSTSCNFDICRAPAGALQISFGKKWPVTPGMSMTCPSWTTRQQWFCSMWVCGNSYFRVNQNLINLSLDMAAQPGTASSNSKLVKILFGTFVLLTNNAMSEWPPCTIHRLY